MKNIYEKNGTPPALSSERTEWSFLLQWMVSVMDNDDPSLSFISGCLSYATRPGEDPGITARQSTGCQKVLDRLLSDFHNEQLDCLNVEEK